MAPAKMPARSRRTHSCSWSSDSSALRPVYDVDVSGDAAGERHEPSGERGRRPVELAASREVVGRSASYDSDSGLTPRSRRTVRRTLSHDTEPWPSLSAPPAKPALDTIYSPTHEILHPMQSLLLEKSLSTTLDKPLAIPVRRTMSVDFDRRRATLNHPPTPKPNDFQLARRPLPDHPQLQPNHQNVTTTSDKRTLESTPELDHTEPETTVSEAPGKPSNNVVVIIVDAEKKLTKFTTLDWAINVAVQPGDEIVLLGVLKHVSSPLGYKVVANTDPLVGVNPEILRSAVEKTTTAFTQKLSDSGRRAECEKKNVKLTVRVAPGARARTVVVRELASLKATYAVFDRKITGGRRYYGKHLSCHAVRVRSNGRSIKTIFTMRSTSTAPKIVPGTLTSPSTASSSPTTSDTASSSPSPSSTHFWRRFTPFRSSKNGRGQTTTSPRSTASSEASTEFSPPAAAVDHSLATLDSFMSEMQDFSISLDRSKAFDTSGSKLALQSCVVADSYSYKQGMDAHRIKHRPISVTIPPICAT